MTSLLNTVSEAEFSGLVTSLAKFCGWRVMHQLRSKGTEPGWPDLVLCRPPRLLVVELKTEAGKVTAPQQWWLDSLAECGVETAVWRPSSWPEVEKTLRSVR